MRGTDWFSVHVLAGEDSAVMVLAGELDLAAVAGFEAVFRATSMYEPKEVVVDLSAVTSIDDAGLRALLRARLGERGTQLRVRFDRPSEPCRRLVEALREEELLDPRGFAAVAG